MSLVNKVKGLADLLSPVWFLKELKEFFSYANAIKMVLFLPSFGFAHLTPGSHVFKKIMACHLSLALCHTASCIRASSAFWESFLIKLKSEWSLLGMLFLALFCCVLLLLCACLFCFMNTTLLVYFLTRD